MTNLEKYQDVFCKTFDVDKSALNEEFTPKHVAVWDSMAHMTLIDALEAAFDVMFEPDDLINYGSYLNGIEILKRYGVDFDN